MTGANGDTILVYASHISIRLQYIAETLFPGVQITDSKEALRVSDSPVINYSADRFDETAVWIVPYGLLDETGIREQTIHCFEWEGMTAFFGTGGDIPFDIFSAAFYLLSRYEEYLPNIPDQYGRYSHNSSVAYQHGFLRTPLINNWLLLLEKIIQKKFYSSFSIQRSAFRFVPTYDIDEAYCYLHQPVWKNVLRFYRDLLQGRFEKVMESGNVYSGRKADPFDTFDWLDTLHSEYGLQPIYFLLTIIKRGVQDKNLPASNKALQRLYKKIAGQYHCGLHPSWQSGTDEWLLEKELTKMQEITGLRALKSRNHYLRFTVPHTYRRLIAAGIADDYSMAYGSVNGFRASYAMPFRWYDIEKETVTDLTVHPFCFMEASSFFHQGYRAAEAGEEVQYYYDTVKAVQGEFITLFHNHFLTEQREWADWRNMYARFLENNFSRK